MPQSFTLYPDLTVRENVDFVGSLFGMIFFSRRRRTKQVLKLVDLCDVRNRRACRSSGGMQRRLELACALVHAPAMLFLDEPTAGVDPLLRNRIREELHAHRDAGRTLLVTTQYVKWARGEPLVRRGLRAPGRARSTRPRSGALPATHGIRLFQDVMLRGGTTETWEFPVLGLIALVTLAFAWVGLRRGMTRA